MVYNGQVEDNKICFTFEQLLTDHLKVYLIPRIVINFRLKKQVDTLRFSFAFIMYLIIVLSLPLIFPIPRSL